MRFELGLRELPRVRVEEAKEKLEGLPKGVSVGLIIRGMQDNRVPSVSVAWSEDKRVINEIQDRLADMGAECYVVDHGFFVLRIATFLAEKMGASRYRKVEKENHTYSPLSLYAKGKRAELKSAFARHLLIFVAQLAVIEGLFIWRVALRTGAQSVSSAPWLPSMLIACGVGVFVAYALTQTIEAFRTKKAGLTALVPVSGVSLLVTVVSLFHFNAGLEEEIAKRSVGRPPSNPFAGLLVELRRRAGDEVSAEDAAEQVNLAADETALACVDVHAALGLAECLNGPAWDLMSACLPAPKLPGLPPLKVTIEKSEVVASPFAPVAAKPRIQVVHTSGVTFELVHLSILLLVWLLSLVGVHFLLARRSKRPSKSAGEAVNTHEESAPEAVPPIVAGDSNTANPETVMQVQALEQELEQTRAALLAHREAVVQLRQELLPARELHAAQSAEIVQLRQALAQLRGRETGAQVVAQPRGDQAPLAAAPANNQGVFRKSPAANPFDEERPSSSYSVTSSQEERITVPKRRT